MNPALWAAKTGLDAQQTRLAVTSNNLANVSTSGFKKGRAVFEDLLYQNVRQVGGSTSQDTAGALGRAPRHRRARGRHRKALHAGRSARRPAMRSTWPSKAAASSRSRCPTAPPPTRATAASSCRAQGQMVTSSGYALQPGITHSRRRAEHHHRPRRHGQRARRRPAGARAGRPAAAHRLRESRRPAAAAAKTCWPKPRPAARRRPARRARTASAPPRRATSKPRTSTWSKSWST